jgi:hypothetical protein
MNIGSANACKSSRMLALPFFGQSGLPERDKKVSSLNCRAACRPADEA